MTIIIKRITPESFIKGHVSSPDAEGIFKVYALIDNNKNTTFEDIRGLTNNNDKADARGAFIKLLARAGTGQPFHNTFDGRQYHTGHEFNYDDTYQKIWRLWLSGVTRIYFVYLPNQIIVILKTLAKRKDDLNKAEKAELETIAKKVLDCCKSKQVFIIEDKK